jgi:CubicO group peptidase (beta-lactamase class C family)
VKEEIDSYLEEAMDLHNIPGLALAMVEDGQVVYKNYFGKASLEEERTVDENTLFRIFSATKLISATAVFQLIEDGRLNLDDRISKYLDDLPKHWQDVQIKNLLSHSSGLPDIIRYESKLSDKELMEILYKDKMDFETGNQFRYNQTNYWLLAQIMAQITGSSFDQFVLEKQFDNATKGVVFSSNSQEVIPNRATRYFYNNKTKEFDKDTNNNGKRGHSGNGLNITLDRFIEWDSLLDNDQLLSYVAKSKMWTPFRFGNQKDEFLHGWGSYSVGGVESYGFSGGNLAAFRKFVSKKRTIILLSNGYEIPAYDIIVNDISRILDSSQEMADPTLEEEVMKKVLKDQFAEALDLFKKLREENPGADFGNLKWNINSIGNALTNEGNQEKAFEVFKFNAAANPEWWVALAGVAESSEALKDTMGAIDNYREAIKLNADNEWDYNEQMQARIEELEKGMR